MGLPTAWKKDRGHLDGAGEDHQGQEDPEGHFREFPVVAGVGHIGGLTEHSYHKPGRKFKIRVATSPMITVAVIA